MTAPFGARPAPLVFIHGVSDDHSSWDDVVSRLGPRFDVITYDLRGHGAAPTRPLVRTVDDFVDDLVELLDTQGVSAANIVGFSLGGLIAQRLAVRESPRVRTLTVIGTVADRTDEDRSRVRQRLAQIERLGPVGVAEQSIERWFTAEYLARHPEVRGDVLRRMDALDPEAYAAAYRVLATTDLAEDLPAIKAPVLAIAGEHDLGSPPRMSKLIAKATGGRCVVVPRVRHNLLQEAPHIIAKELTTHVS
ncbi:alpha/beta fold hydrolase [Streptomyces canus]|uniref:alpha/beta fold hydrolase n=1 Tax=Streptomyces canus TaxID=58343 RepID=UPI00340F27A4